MRRFAWGILVLMASLSVVPAVGNGQDKPPTPAEQYKALLKESRKGPGGAVPETDAEREQYVGRAYKHEFAVAQKFLALAEKHPNDTVGLEARDPGVWKVSHNAWRV